MLGDLSLKYSLSSISTKLNFVLSCSQDQLLIFKTNIYIYIYIYIKYSDQTSHCYFIIKLYFKNMSFLKKKELFIP